LAFHVEPVRAQVRPRGICGEQSGIGAGFLRVLQFPLPIIIPPAGKIGPLVDDIASGLSHPTPRNNNKKYNIHVYIDRFIYS
jgi:hypothetical protein